MDNVWGGGILIGRLGLRPPSSIARNLARSRCRARSASSSSSPSSESDILDDEAAMAEDEPVTTEGSIEDWT